MIYFSNNVASICDDICKNIVSLSDVDKISREYAEYHIELVGESKKKGWDPHTWITLIPPKCWTKRVYGRSIHVKCSKKTKRKLLTSFIKSNGFNILTLLNFVINCEKSQLYSNHILVAIILKSLFKYKCHLLARYIIYLIDKYFDLINVKDKIFDINIQYGFWSCTHDGSDHLDVNTSPFIIYNIDSNVEDRDMTKSKITFTKDERIKLEEKVPDDLESQYELHRQWCQYIKYDWYIPGEISGLHVHQYLYDEWSVYLRDLIYIQAFEGENVIKKHNISVENRRKFFYYVDCEKVERNRVPLAPLTWVIGPIIPIHKDINFYPKWLSRVTPNQKYQPCWL